MTKWEYRYEIEVSRKRIDELGAEGWELVVTKIGVDYGDDEEHSGIYFPYAILKRPAE